jgi:large subunit ribosomal protein L25
MSDAIELTAEIRVDVGKGASRRLRRLGEKVPAIIYGAGDPPQMLSLAVNQLTKVMQAEAFYSQILNVVVDGKPQQAVVRDLHRNPINERVMHVDFLRIIADQELQVSVPLHFVNEEECVGVKIDGGTITHSLTEVEISCLPAVLPQFIEVDMLDVAIGSSVHLSDLNLPDGVTIVALTHGEDRDIPVSSVTARRGGTEEAEEEAAAAAAAEAAEGEEGATDADAGGDDSDES